MPAIVERTFKAARDIVTGTVPDRRHSLGRSQASASRTTNKKQVVTQFHTEGPPDLIIEVVSPESQSRDRREKFLEYQSAGVPEYWIIDPDSRTCEAYALGKNRKYRLVAPDDGVVRSKVLPGFFVDPTWLWRDRFPKVSTLVRQMRPNARKK